MFPLFEEKEFLHLEKIMNLYRFQMKSKVYQVPIKSVHSIVKSIHGYNFIDHTNIFVDHVEKNYAMTSRRHIDYIVTILE